MTAAPPLAFLAAVVACFLYADQKYDLVGQSLPAPATTARLLASGYMPKPASKQAEFAENTLLRDRAVRIFEGHFRRPVVHSQKFFSLALIETVAVSADGKIYGVEHRNFLRSGVHKGADSHLQRESTHLGPGQGLALEFDASGDLIICIAGAGLYKVEMDTQKVVLLTSVVSSDSPLDPGTVINYAEDLDIAANGTIYFTDGTSIPPHAPDYEILPPVNLAVFEAAMKGRLLAFDPHTRKTRVLAKGFWFANGCALAKDESYILVADTISSRVEKFYLKGPKAGQREIIIDGLPGHPDNIRAAKDGTFWVGLSAKLREQMFPVIPYKHVRALIARLPPWLLPKDPPFGAIVQINGEGKVLRYLEDPKGQTLSATTAVTEGKDGLYIGTFTHDYIGYLAYKDLPPPFP